jgi:hypothetical protein
MPRVSAIKSAQSKASADPLYLLTDSDERSFPLDSSLFLSLGPTLDPAAPSPAPLSFSWLDPDGDGPDDEFEFVLAQASTSANELATDFERLSWRCMWERQEGRDWPADQKEAEEIEVELENMFKVQ